MSLTMSIICITTRITLRITSKIMNNVIIPNLQTADKNVLKNTKSSINNVVLQTKKWRVLSKALRKRKLRKIPRISKTMIQLYHRLSPALRMISPVLDKKLARDTCNVADSFARRVQSLHLTLLFAHPNNLPKMLRFRKL